MKRENGRFPHQKVRTAQPKGARSVAGWPGGPWTQRVSRCRGRPGRYMHTLWELALSGCRPPQTHS